MENSHRFFRNEACKYFPCHKGLDTEEFNCLFCFCPMNAYEDCLGNPRYIQSKRGKRVKDCSGCTFPHRPENYPAIMEYLAEKP